MNNEDFDLEKFVDLFDTAMTSDNPTVRKAFKNLMMVAALVEAENENKIGPLRRIVDDVKDLQSRLSIIEISRPTIGVTGSITGTTPYSPTWTTTMPSTAGYTNTYNGNYGLSNSNVSGTINEYKFNQLFDNLESKN